MGGRAGRAPRWAADPDRTRTLAAAVAYPAAAGKATNVLLDAGRSQRPDAPAKDKGARAALEWLARRYPEISPPVCPLPPRRYETYNLKCPTAEAEASADGALGAKKDSIPP